MPVEQLKVQLTKQLTPGTIPFACTVDQVLSTEFKLTYIYTEWISDDLTYSTYSEDPAWCATSQFQDHDCCQQITTKVSRGN